MEKNKLTAYALNEVTDAERAEIEKYLELHPEEKRNVEEIKAVSAILRSEMASDLVVATPEFSKTAKKAKSHSAWSLLFNRRTVAVGFSIAFVGVISFVVVIRESDRLLRDSSSKSSVSMNQVITGPVSRESIAQKEAPTESGAIVQGEVSREMADMNIPSAPPASHNYAKKSQGFYSAPKVRGELGATSSSVRGFGGAPNGLLMESDQRGQEEYKLGAENDFIAVTKESLSTFSIDVDTASYANSRRYLNSYNQLPPLDAIRSEEFINYFDYDYKAPTSGHPIAMHMEATRSPWNEKRAIIRVGLKAKELDLKDRPKSNLVFLIDVSGSMADENKMPLVKSALRTLSEQLQKDDRISMVVYAGQSGVILDSVSGSSKDKILDAIQKLSSGGGTNGEGGIRKAYELAQKNFVSGGNNRVILASDGDFNVGVTSPDELLKIIKDKSEGGVFLTVLGFGMGNYKDARLEEISNKGQGNYFYIDSEKEANKVFVNQLAGTLYTVAKDVKVQVEFNPKLVHSYRLVGYENRMLQKEDFANDKVDAGEMGAGHSVTALYEIEWAGSQTDLKLKYQPTAPAEKTVDNFSDEIMTVKVRYKKPQNSSSEYFEVPLKNKVSAMSEASCSTRFAVAVASFSQWMRGSKHLEGFDSGRISEMAQNCLTTNDRRDTFKDEFVDLVKKAREIKGK